MKIILLTPSPFDFSRRCALLKIAGQISLSPESGIGASLVMACGRSLTPPSNIYLTKIYGRQEVGIVSLSCSQVSCCQSRIQEIGFSKCRRIRVHVRRMIVVSNGCIVGKSTYHLSFHNNISCISHVLISCAPLKCPLDELPNSVPHCPISGHVWINDCWRNTWEGKKR